MSCFLENNTQQVHQGDIYVVVNIYVCIFDNIQQALQDCIYFSLLVLEFFEEWNITHHGELLPILEEGL